MGLPPIKLILILVFIDPEFSSHVVLAMACSISTGLTTLDAMLQKLSTFRITAKCKGDVWIDEHHSTEDVMITVGILFFFLHFWGLK